MKKIYLIGADMCKPCEDVKEKIKDLMKKGIVEYKDINDPEVSKITNGDKEEVPFGVVETDKGFKKCEIFADDKNVLLKCEGEDDLIPLK